MGPNCLFRDGEHHDRWIENPATLIGRISLSSYLGSFVVNTAKSFTVNPAPSQDADRSSVHEASDTEARKAINLMPI